jgi:hypothetical protein
MRLKLLTAAVVVAGAFGITTGSALLSQAEAQNFVPLAGTQLGPPPRATTTTTTDLQVTLGGGGQAAADPAVALPTTATTITTGGPGMMAVVVGEMKWDYKFVDLTNNDRDSFEKEIRQAGSQGWEFCGSERLMKKANEGQALVLVFKKQHGTPAAVMGQASGFGGPGNQAGGSSGYGFGPRGMAPAPQPTPGGSGAPSATPAPGGGMSRGTTNTFQVDQQRSVYTSDTDKLVAVFKLHHVDATNVARALTTGFYANKNVMIVAEPVSNTILVAANDGVYQQIKKTIEELDAPSNKPFPTPPPRPEPAASTGTTTVYPNPRPTAEARGVALPAQGTQKVGEGHPTSTPKPLLPSVNAPGAGEAVTVMDVRFARVEELSMTLSRVFPEARITFDQRTNQLIFQADPEATQEITKLVKKLDVDVPAKNGR